MIQLISCTWGGGALAMAIPVQIIMRTGRAANMSYRTFSRSNWKLQGQLPSPWCPSAAFLERCSGSVVSPFDHYDY